ncbi:hypothetical protein PRIPAC_77845 [Pristionchus pacificus]|uniref:Alpha-mannosidase n=1 Tax=Pristionchus pacificus TaxID=54126 RepID=A0A2A6CN95_PRIPA|nr:hypothetical protein PRIPAC_77845 [Pristionchus pacificus]|eukprot:PDM79570.1 glycoside hydrolase [Pristionchus pacificus]
MRPSGRKFNLCVLFVLIGTAILLLMDFRTDSIAGVSRLRPFLAIVGGNYEDEGDAFEMAPPASNEELFVPLLEQKTDMKVEGTILTINNRATPVAKPLNVHIVLHSHVDPGWLETFEEYYVNKVKSILDLAVDWLTKTPRLRFIWSEISFLQRWWSDATEQQKTQMKRLLANRQLEICGGAWVMTDEATPHFSATIDNMIEGQRWVKDVLGLRPNTSWSVDPFGHGLMVPALLAASGIEKMVIGRLNDHQKQQMRETMNLRFHWKQPFYRNETTPVPAPFVNSLPYLYYTTRNACGPDDSVCCKYHPGPSANWCSGTYHRVGNIENHVAELLHQYRIVQKLYNSEHVLIPVGDDFYLSKNDDWKEVVELYTAIMDHINKTPSLNAKMEFSSVGDFFDAISADTEKAPTLTGDFFPYTQNEHQSYKWWTGYFSHRPYFKRMGRIVESRLRTFDLLSVLVGSVVSTPDLVQARRDIALFQHHDAITGTSKRHVMEDYLERLLKAHSVFSSEAGAALAALTVRPPKSVQSLEKTPKYVNCKGPAAPVECTPTKLPEGKVIAVPHGMKVTILAFNPLLNTREHVVRVRVSRSDVRVLRKGEPISPVYDRELVVQKDVFDLVFLADIAPLSTGEFVIEGAADEANTVVAKAKDDSAPGKSFASLKNSLLEVKIFAGAVDNIIINGNATDVQFELTSVGDRGGSYVLETSETKKETLTRPDKIAIIHGPIEKKLISYYSKARLQTEITVVAAEAAHLVRAVDIRIRPDTADGSAIFFDVASKLFNDGQFFTDANGMYMMKRTYNEQKPFDANVFPAASTTFMQDKLNRFSVHLGQPNGVVGSKNGKLQILVDRVVSVDDGKGLPFGEDHDDHSPDVRLRFFPESRAPAVSPISPSLSVPSQRALDSLRNPLSLFMVRQQEAGDYEDAVKPGASLFSLWPTQLEIVTLRFVTDRQILLIVRRITFDDTVVASSEGATTDLDAAWRAVSAVGKKATHANLAGTETFKLATGETFLKSLETPFALSPFLIDLL